MIGAGGRRGRRGRRALVLALALGSVAGVPACSSDGDSGATTTTTRPAGSPVDGDDAARLAQMLFRNQRLGGARLDATVTAPGGLAISITGEIDFAGHAGRLEVTTRGPGGAPTEELVVFEQDAVYVPVTEAEAAALAGRGRPEVTWIRHPPAPEDRPIDQVIGLLVSLSATRPDNPQLLGKQAFTYEGTQGVEGVTADAFRAGGSGSTYWLATEDDRLVRFQGVLVGFEGPLVVDLHDPGAVVVEVPSGAEVIDADEVPGA